MFNPVYRLMLPMLLLSVVSAPLSATVRAATATSNVRLLDDLLPMAELQRERQLRLYLPPSYADSPQRRYPVLYMHDGQNLFDDATSYAGEWGVDECMNALAQSHGFEAIVVGIDHGGERRMNELSPWAHEKSGVAEGEQYLRFVVDVVKPYVDSHYRTRPEREHTAIMGSSMGGLASHYALLHSPQVFSRAAIFSPSYWFAPAVFDFSREHRPPADSRIYLYVGGEGEDMLQPTRRMYQLLREAGDGDDGAAVSLSINEEAGHNEAAWRAEFTPALIWLFELQERPAN